MVQSAVWILFDVLSEGGRSGTCFICGFCGDKIAIKL